MTNASIPNLQLTKIPLREKSSREALSFVDFILAARVKASPRGDLIALYRTLINASVFPAIAAWPDLYRFMVARRASDETINEARKLWRQYQKSQIAVSPGSTRRANHG